MLSAQRFAADTTSGSVNISFRFFPMFFRLLLIESIFLPESPNPIWKPFLNSPANSLHLLRSESSFLLVLSITVSPSASFPKSVASPKLAVPVPLGFEVVVLSFLSSLLIWSNPIRDLSCFAAFFAAVPTLFVDSLRLSAAPDALCRLSSAVPASSDKLDIGDSTVLDPLDFCPVINSVKLLNALAKVASLPINVLTALIIGVNRFIRPCPIVAFSESNCSCKIRTWFAQLPDVLAKSPCAADN